LFWSNKIKTKIRTKLEQNQNKIRTKLNKIKTKSKQYSKNILIKFDLLNFIKNNLQILNIHGWDFLHQIYMEYNSFFY
jgi:hypothetical protein